MNKITFKISKKLKQNRKVYNKNPLRKDYYADIYKIIKKNNLQNILDIGCANGAFSYYLNNQTKITGIDVDNVILRVAQKINIKGINRDFKNINIFNDSSKSKEFIKKNIKKFDLVTIFGTFHLFKDYKNTIKILKKLNPKMIIMTTMLNSLGDVSIIHKLNGEKNWDMTYNFFSQKNLVNFFHESGYNVKILNYEMKKFIKKTVGTRNYHIRKKNNKKILVNDLGLFFNEKIIIAKKK
jgi:2-polyprenyl-3-methyl-5-hydroxy-6-metoxy-1,4-benzoquinol methylase